MAAPRSGAQNPQNYSVDESAGADVTIACMGLSPMMEGEEGDAILTAENGDRPTLSCPPYSWSLSARSRCSGGHVVLVLFGGSPIALGDMVDLVDAMVFVWYPGQEGGRAVADVLFGDITPSGKLPITFPQSTAQLPPFEDYAMAGRTYRYMTQVPLYPFGFGLSYTQFAYSDLQLARPTIASGESQPARLTVTNSGCVPAEEVVQFYFSDLAASTVVPQQSLVGFRRVHLARRRARARLQITPDMILLVDDEGWPVLEPGAFRLTVGGCSPPRCGRPRRPRARQRRLRSGGIAVSIPGYRAPLCPLPPGGASIPTTAGSRTGGWDPKRNPCHKPPGCPQSGELRAVRAAVTPSAPSGVPCTPAVPGLRLRVFGSGYSAPSVAPLGPTLRDWRNSSRWGSRNGGSTKLSPRVAGSSSTAKPGWSEAISKRLSLAPESRDCGSSIDLPARCSGRVFPEALDPSTMFLESRCPKRQW